MNTAIQQFWTTLTAKDTKNRNKNTESKCPYKHGDDKQTLPPRKRQVYPAACGYATQQSRLDWFAAHGIPTDQRAILTSKDLTANPDVTQPLYYWQLFSLLGHDRIYALIRRFYRMVLDDREDPGFRHAFTRIGGLEHHVAKQVQYWQDAMGGGRRYHGSSFRLKFHHEHNAHQVMNAAGARRWMYHMTRALKEFEPVFKALDPRIPACIIDFLETKMKKYAKQFGWRFDGRDFNAVKSQNTDAAMAVHTYNSTHSTHSSTPITVPVYGRGELKKMPLKTLQEICRALQLDTSGCVERQDLVRVMETSGRAAVADRPAFALAALRQMSVGALKQMAKCLRVDTSRCVEKKDLISAIVASGRIDVLAHDAPATAASANDASANTDPSPPTTDVSMSLRHRGKLAALFNAHNPKMLKKMDALLIKHAGAEADLIHSFSLKYGEIEEKIE